MKTFHSSESIITLAAALCKAQAEMPIVVVDSVNTHFKKKYSSFRALVEDSRPTLTKFGLSVTQLLHSEDDKMYLATILLHTSGEWIASKIAIITTEAGIQKLGGAITYLKRYSYASIIGLVDGEDDDGEDDRKYYEKKQPAGLATWELSNLIKSLEGMPDFEHTIVDGLAIGSLDRLPKERYASVLKRIQDERKSRGLVV